MRLKLVTKHIVQFSKQPYLRVLRQSKLQRTKINNTDRKPEGENSTKKKKKIHLNLVITHERKHNDLTIQLIEFHNSYTHKESNHTRML